MASRVPLRVLTRVVRDRLSVVGNATHYLAEVSPTPPTISPLDARVRPYTVLYQSPGVSGIDRRADDHVTGRAWAFQLTCVAGDNEAIDPLIDAVTAVLDDWRPTLPEPYGDVEIGRLRQLRDYDPGPVRRDDSELPPRFWTPLQYRLPIYA